MHYRDGTPVRIGDRVALADPMPVEGKRNIEPHMVANAKDYEGVVLGRSFKESSCGAVVASDFDDSPLALYAADCPDKPGLIVRCRFSNIPTELLRKVG